MLDTSNSGSEPLRHDAETFRVAKELIMLSSLASSTDVQSDDSHSYVSGFFENTTIREKHTPKTKVRKRRSQSRTHRTLASLPNQRKTNTCLSHGSAHKSRVQDDIKHEDIINSRCDISHSELLNEHRVRFRRVRQRWNMEQRTRKREHLARFQVQGIPLVQHLKALTHWR